MHGLTAWTDRRETSIPPPQTHHTVMSPEDADGMANIVDTDQTAPSQTSLIWVYTVCPDLSVPSRSTLFVQTSLSDLVYAVCPDLSVWLGLHCLSRPVCLIWVYTVCPDLSVWSGDLGLHCLSRSVCLIWWSGSTLFVQICLSDLGLHCLSRPVCPKT